ncbi:N2227-like protein-domain-containing protein [Kickxella alabastrina]|uniref:N2227-like protein-domain-containing protein n=1 Tax=Kickxella alabastrina TaxID=61397 RepID=UPI0022203C38|nr:N2227-like protein-domain-containing protein [Kickxella alabastrina]KAI7831922.1 N2227-like protein-domain-containing protein [Kickxella alabastrina]
MDNNSDSEHSSGHGHGHSGGHGHGHGHAHGHGHSHEHGGCSGDHGDPDLAGAASNQGEDEAKALSEVIAAFLFYKQYTVNGGIYRRLHHLDNLSERHRSIVSSVGTIDKIKNAEKLVRENQQFLLSLVHASTVDSMPDPADSESGFKLWSKRFFEFREKSGKSPVADQHMDKVYSVLKQFVRDWSEEGKEEREQTYGPLLESLESEFAQVPPESRGDLRVLVPGAGLGRLAYEICCRGFSSQGNEFSFFMLFASNFILNSSEQVGQYMIYPFVHQFSNVVRAEDQLRAVQIPDVLPSKLPFPQSAEFSMTAGDFIEVYSGDEEKEQWDAVVTCFFMDTAKNVLDYLDVVWNVMKPGAVWINLGPLLWHFENVADESSIEFTRDEFVDIVKRFGFEWDEQQFKECVPTSYTANGRGMLQYTYRSFMSVARKPR